MNFSFRKKAHKESADLNFILNDQRYEMFRNAMVYVNYEMVEGDILEFGVWAGKTLALLGYLNQYNYPCYEGRKLYGFDSFEGLQNMTEVHPRWYNGICRKNLEGNHPTCGPNQPVNAKVVYSLFDHYRLNRPILKEGYFSSTIRPAINREIKQVALVHLDCDLYESTLEVLEGIEPVLSSGAMLLFDDFYHYRANPRKGQARALNEFIKAYEEKWELIKFKTYHNVCQSFFIVKRND